MKNAKKIMEHDNVALEFWEVWRTVLTVNQTRNRDFDLRVFYWTTGWKAGVFYDTEHELQLTDHRGQVSSSDNWRASTAVFLERAPCLALSSQQT